MLRKAKVLAYILGSNFGFLSLGRVFPTFREEDEI